MTKQEIFDKVARHLIVQNAKSEMAKWVAPAAFQVRSAIEGARSSPGAQCSAEARAMRTLTWPRVNKALDWFIRIMTALLIGIAIGSILFPYS